MVAVQRLGGLLLAWHFVHPWTCAADGFMDVSIPVEEKRPAALSAAPVTNETTPRQNLRAVAAQIPVAVRAAEDLGADGPEADGEDPEDESEDFAAEDADDTEADDPEDDDLETAGATASQGSMRRRRLNKMEPNIGFGDAPSPGKTYIYLILEGEQSCDHATSWDPLWCGVHITLAKCGSEKEWENSWKWIKGYYASDHKWEPEVDDHNRNYKKYHDHLPFMYTMEGSDLHHLVDHLKKVKDGCPASEYSKLHSAVAPSGPASYDGKKQLVLSKFKSKNWVLAKVKVNGAGHAVREETRR